MLNARVRLSIKNSGNKRDLKKGPIDQQHQTNLTEAHKATLTHKAWVLWWAFITSTCWWVGVFVAFYSLFQSNDNFVDYFPIALIVSGSSAALGVPLLVLYAVFKKDLPIKELRKVIKEAANLAGKGN